MSHLLPYIAIGAAVALVIAAFGVWMAWCDLIDSGTGLLVRRDAP